MVDKSESVSGVFYIDGSCRPHNPGYIGWGIHGYLFKDTCEKPVISEQFIHTTHGYISVNDEIPQSAQLVTPVKYLDGYGSFSELRTNNVAEIKGLYYLLEYLSKMDISNIRVYTDSEYLKTSMNEWCKRWEKTNWLKQDGTPVGNREILEKTYNLTKTLKDKGVDFSIHWIRSHNGHLGNERADVLAGIGMSHSQQRSIVNKIETYNTKGYWKSEFDKNPYIALPGLFFNSLQEFNRPGAYHLAVAPEIEFLIGKPSASAAYSVLYLKEHDPVIELIKKKQFEVSRGINVVVLMKLDSIYSKSVYPWLESHGHHAIMMQKNSHSMELVNKKPITLEMNPTGLSLRTIEHFSMLEEILQAFIQSKADKFLIGAREVTSFDITDKFFNTIKDKKGKERLELKPEFIVGYKNLSLNIEIDHNKKKIPIKVPYVLGYDCLPRNNLKHLETAEPKIYLLYWKEGNTLRYCTIIESDYGIGVWSNYFANQLLLPP